MSLPEGQLLYQLDFPVRWGDMDAMGHVNNIMYLRYFEQARLEWYAQLGYPPLSMNGEGMVVVDNHAEYVKPVVYPMHVKVAMGGHSPGRSSFTSTYVLTVGDEVFTRGSAKIVWIDMSQGRSVPLPDKVRQLIVGSET